ncbi:MAG: hypothetical protein PUE46_02120 [Eubacteriales bacterium]|nr:hypothetical protein [Eubacteriales bacterium]
MPPTKIDSIIINIIQFFNAVIGTTIVVLFTNPTDFYFMYQ